MVFTSDKGPSLGYDKTLCCPQVRLRNVCGTDVSSDFVLPVGDPSFPVVSQYIASATRYTESATHKQIVYSPEDKGLEFSKCWPTTTRPTNSTMQSLC